MSAAAPVDISSFTGIALAIVSLVAVALKWFASRDHNPRLAVLENDMEDAQKIIQQVQTASPAITAAINSVPELKDYMTKNQAAIAALEKQLDDAKNSIQQLQSLVPADAKVSARALIFHQQRSETAPAP